MFVFSLGLLFSKIMSIIIRLQNLPWSASSSDIRYFFRGFEIPEGGVHIIGGDNGDAFIAFESDDDARLAMQKDGLRLRGNYVKLVLSSRSEMLQLTEKVRSSHEHRTMPDHSAKRPKPSKHSQQLRSPERRHYDSYRHPSSKRSRRSRSLSHSRQSRSLSPHRNSRQRSRSARHSSTARRSSPTYRRDVSDEKLTMYKKLSRTGHIREHDQMDPHQEIQYPEVRFVDSSELYDRRSPLPSLEIPSSHTAISPNIFHSQEHFHGMSENVNKPAHRSGLEPHPFYEESKFEDEGFGQYSSHPSAYKSTFGESEWGHNTYETVVPSWPPGQNKSDFNRTNKLSAGPPPDVAYPRGPRHACREVQNYCIQLSGFPQNASFKDVQSALKRIYAPQRNIKWDVNNCGYKSGTAYVRLSNVDDFNKVLSIGELAYDNLSICVTKCPDDVFFNLFSSNEQNAFQPHSENIPNDFCYMLKGLPYGTTEDDVMNFFSGLNLADMMIFYDKNGKATGTGYVQFSSLADYNSAFERNGKKIGHRYIELFEASREDMDDARSTAVAVSKPMEEILNEQMFLRRSQSFKHNALEKRPLCVVLSGLPPDITASGVFAFFKVCGIRPDAVHIVLNETIRHPNGRAFAEFLDLFDLDVALKQHGKFIGDYMVSVKQMLFEEMMKILDTHSVMHDFGITLRKSENSGPLPEKLPYIWEPPDANDDLRQPSVELSRVNNSQRSAAHRLTNSQFYKDQSLRTGGAVRPNFGTGDSFDRTQHPAFRQNWSATESSSMNQGTFHTMQNKLDPNTHTMQGDYRNAQDFFQTLNQSSKISDLQNVSNPFSDVAVSSSFSPAHRDLEYHHVSSQPFISQDGSNYQSISHEALSQRDVIVVAGQTHCDSSAQNKSWSSFGDPQNLSNVHYNQDVPFDDEGRFFQQGDQDNFGYVASNHFNPPESRKSFKGNRTEPPGEEMVHPSDNFRMKSIHFNARKKSGQSWNKTRNIPEHHQGHKSAFQGSNDEKGLAGEPTFNEDRNRIPIKFGVKSRQSVSTSEKLKAAFDSVSDKDNEKRKLRKLSPGISSAAMEHSASKSATQENKQAKSESRVKDKELKPAAGSTQKQDKAIKSVPGQKVSKLDKEPFDKTKSDKKITADNKNRRNKRNFASANHSSPQRQTNRDPYPGDRLRDMQNNRSRNKNPDFTHHHSQESSGFEDSSMYESCTVQVSNVPPYCGLKELLHFFSGFDILGENIIRRYTDSGEPTGDVRVTLVNAQEAKRATRLLNQELLAGVPVFVFSV